jgi:hypothetical protein
MCEPVTLGVLASAATYGGAALTGAIGSSAAVAAGTASMTAIQALGLAATVGSGVMAAGSMYQQGQVAQDIAKNNAKMAEYAAQDQTRLGELQAQELSRKGAQLKGQQRSLMAARGLDLSVGTPAEILDQTSFFTETDVNTARYNARRNAWSYRAQGDVMRTEGSAAAKNANLKAFSTLLGTAGSVASMWGSTK